MTEDIPLEITSSDMANLPIFIAVLIVATVVVRVYFWLFGGFCGRDSGIGPAQRAKTTIWN